MSGITSNPVSVITSFPYPSAFHFWAKSRIFVVLTKLLSPHTPLNDQWSIRGFQYKMNVKTFQRGGGGGPKTREKIIYNKVCGRLEYKRIVYGPRENEHSSGKHRLWPGPSRWIIRIWVICCLPLPVKLATANLTSTGPGANFRGATWPRGANFQTRIYMEIRGPTSQGATSWGVGGKKNSCCVWGLFMAFSGHPGSRRCQCMSSFTGMKMNRFRSTGSLRFQRRAHSAGSGPGEASTVGVAPHTLQINLFGIDRANALVSGRVHCGQKQRMSKKKFLPRLVKWYVQKREGIKG